MSQVIKKRRIVLASVLKPVDDTRMFEKLGVSLAESGDYEVTIIGYPSTTKPVHEGIAFISLSEFRRFSLGRLLAPWSILRKINSLRADIVIINTPELLLIGLISRLFYRRVLVYDVLENYYRNIRFTSVYPSLMRIFLAPLVRFKEIISAPFVNLFLLAEKGYTLELSFAKPHIVLQNKLPVYQANQFSRTEPRGYSRLIFTGTLSPTTGVFEAINLCQELYKVDPSFTLNIVGHSAQPTIIRQIRKAIEGLPFIKLTGGEKLVPHDEILRAIQDADAGIIIYPLNPSTQSSIPTKLFEYLASKIPILIQHNAASHDLLQRFNAGIILGPENDYTALTRQLKERKLMPSPTPDIYWESEVVNFTNYLKNQ